MVVAHPFQGAQKLKVSRSDDGQVAGCLQCSVFLNFGAQAALVFEEILPDVPVSYVLNPQSGTFLGDEVQRLMRLGIASWLSLELNRERISSRSRCAPEGDWEVSFRLPMLDGEHRDLSVSVAASTAREHVDALALERVKGWIDMQQYQALDDELASVFEELDLKRAPHLRNGLALVNLPACDLETN